jgi:twitching motility protein PilJ
LPVGRKQLLALIVCELIPILGLGAGFTWILINSLRTQLLAQAQSEVAVTEINYNIKVNQMGLGSRGESDNPAVVAAAKAGQGSNDNLKEQVKQILQNEVKARRMEYATLIGKDLRVIVNANTSRAGEAIAAKPLLDLVQQVLKEGRQIKANAIVDWNELQKEGAPVPQGIANQDALIRYVVTPVRDAVTQEVTGVLMFGDVVNGKLSIVEDTQKSFGGGYSAVYLGRPGGEFALATSQKQTDAPQPQALVPLSDNNILAAAAKAKGAAVTQRIEVGGQTYTVAAKAIPDRIVEAAEGPVPSRGEAPVAILVRGTPETNLNQLLMSSLSQQALALLLALGGIGVWVTLFHRSVLRPILKLQRTTEKFAAGDRAVRAEVFATDEIGQLAGAFNQMADSITESEQVLSQEAGRQARQAQEAKAISDITVKMRQLYTAESIWQFAAEEVRRFLEVDRVVILQFKPTLDHEVIAESVSTSSLSVMGQPVSDWLGLGQWQSYVTASFWTMEDVEQQQGQYRANLAAFGVKAELVAPVKRGNGQTEQVVALVCAQKCSQVRPWTELEQGFMAQLAVQVGYALDQAQLFQDRQVALQDSELLKDSLQQQIMRLLSEVQGVARGDLTLRASQVPGDLGTVADFFNAIVASLEKIVLKVQQSSTQVSQLLGENDAAMQQVAHETEQQAHETSRILDSVGQMTQTVQVVSERAAQASVVAETATTAAQNAETAVDKSVQSIMRLRSTIEDATQKVKQLGESSSQIGRVVSLINELAVQTDLLAINASIEASRAGEQGRGFGIVATEIGELASRSAAATRDIEKMIDTVQHQVSTVVEVMNQGATQVVEGAHSVKNTKQGFVHIVYVSKQIDELVKSISQAVATQEQTSRSLSDVIQKVADVSSRTSESSRRMSTALHQTSVVAEELQQSVGMFRIKLTPAE